MLWLIFRILVSSCIVSLMYSVPRSVSIVLNLPKIKIRLSARDCAIVRDSLLGRGAAIRYFVKLHIIVRTYLLPRAEVGKGPIVSTTMKSKGFSGVSVIQRGSQCFGFGLLSWHFVHLLT